MFANGGSRVAYRHLGDAPKQRAPAGLTKNELHVLQVLARLDDTITHAGLCLAEPFAWIVVTLVGLVWAIWVADLALQITILGLVEILDAFPVCPLGVCIHVHLHHTIADSLVY